MATLRPLFDTTRPNLAITRNQTSGQEDGAALTGRIRAVDESFLGSGIGGSGIRSVTVSQGQFGTLQLSVDNNNNPDIADFNYTYIASQSLRHNQTRTENFTVTATDNAGNVRTGTFSLTVTGQNDRPVLEALSMSMQPLQVVEANGAGNTLVPTVLGAFTVRDADVGDTLTAQLVGSPTLVLSGTGSIPDTVRAALTASNAFTFEGSGTFGGNGITANGSNQTIGYSYNPTGTDLDLNFLRTGQTLTVTYTVQVRDNAGVTGTGATSSTSNNQTVTFTFVGTNDGPTLAPVTVTLIDTVGDDNFTTTGPAATNLVGTLAGSDPDGDTLTYGIQGIAPSETGVSTAGNTFGTLTVNASGTYSFAVDDAAVEGLTANTTARFTVTTTDPSGLTGTATLTINITAANDALEFNTALTPISYTDTPDVDTFMATSGRAVATDRDGPVSYGITGGSNPTSDGMITKVGEFGTLVLNRDTGMYTYTPNDTAIEALTADAQDTFTINASSAGSAAQSQTLTINLTGANDTPTFGGTTTGNVTEDAPAPGNAVSGVTVTVADRDANQSGFQTPEASSFAGKYGDFTFTAGAWTYVLDNEDEDTNALFRGQIATDTLTVLSTDGTAQDLTVTITGANDGPVQTAPTVYSEDGLRFTVDDPDTNAVLTVTPATAGFFTSTAVSDGIETFLQVQAQTTAPAINTVTVADQFGASVEVAYVGVGTDRNDGSLTGLFSLPEAGALYGFGGNDILIGSTGNDFLFGGADNDTLLSSEGDDLEVGGAGDDGFFASAGKDTLLGGQGNDLVVGLDLASTGADDINLADSNDAGMAAGDESLFDTVEVASTGQTRVSFISGQVGNGSVLNNGAANAGTPYAGQQAGGLAVRLQREDVDGELVGDIARTDDEGISFVASNGGKFDVRDFQNGAQRGADFDVVTLGTQRGDMIDESGAPLSESVAVTNYYINAGGGKDSIKGGSGNDFLVGGADDDELSGNEGNDSYIGGGGNDIIDGGGAALDAGNDTAIYAAAFSNYEVTKNADGSITISDTRDGSPDGTDTLRGIEVLQFAGVNIAVTPARPTSLDLLAASDTGAEDDDNITNDSTPTVRVNLELGTSLVLAGDTVQLRTGTTVVGSAVLTETDLAAGFVDITANPALTPDGNIRLTARITDVTGAESRNSIALNITLDTATPTATISVADTSLTANETTNVTITFSEVVSELELSDLVAENGALRDLAQSTSNPLVYTATFDPDQNVEDSTNLITLAAGSVADRAGNAVAVTNSANYAIDTKGPVVTGPVDNNATSFRITSSEASTLQLRAGANNVGTLLTLNANVAATVPVTALGTAVIASAVVTDAGGNATTAETDVALGTDLGDTLDQSTSSRDTLFYGFDGNDSLTGGSGDDTIYGGLGISDRLFGGDGNDTIIDTDGAAMVQGGLGDDIVRITFTANNATGTSASQQFGQGGNDTVELTFNNVNPRSAAFNVSTDNNTNNGDSGVIDGQASDTNDGNDELTINGTVTGAGVTFNTNGGNDVVVVNATFTGGKPVFRLGEGNDRFTGGNSSEDVRSHTGSDTLNGGNGVDFITPGADADTVVSDAIAVANADVIYGFLSGTDKFDYNGTLTPNGDFNAVSSSQFANMLQSTPTAEVFIRTTNLTGAESNALNALATATTETTVLSAYANFEAALVANTGILNANNTTFNNALAGAVNMGESVLLVLDNGTHSVALRYLNLQGNGSTSAKAVNGTELELVGVFNNTAQLAAGDFI